MMSMASKTGIRQKDATVSPVDDVGLVDGGFGVVIFGGDTVPTGFGPVTRQLQYVANIQSRTGNN